MINLFDVRRQSARLRDKIDARLSTVLGHGQFVLGPEVLELEQRLADYAGCPEVITVSSGRDALLIALFGEGIGPGDAVFVPAFTFSATAESVTACGATPVFVDVDSRTFNMDPAALEAAVATVVGEGRLVARAVMAVDLFGLPADYRGLRQIAQDRDMLLIADSAQSFGAELEDAKTGTMAPVTAVSFYPTKPLAAFGDGGALLTDDPERAARYRSMRVNGRGPSGLQECEIGMTARLDTMQAAILLAKLEVFDEELSRRRAIAARYTQVLGNEIVAPFVPDQYQSAYALYTVQCDARDRLASHLKEAGVNCGIYYPTPLHLHPGLQKYGKGAGSLPVSERLSERVLSLPMHPDLTDEEVTTVCDAIMDFRQHVAVTPQEHPMMASAGKFRAAPPADYCSTGGAGW